MNEVYTEQDLENHFGTLSREHQFGKEAEEFWGSPLGKYLIGCSLQETEKYSAELKTVDPEDSKKVRELQTNIQIAEKALIWIGDAIQAGRIAKEQFEIEEDLKEEQ